MDKTHCFVTVLLLAAAGCSDPDSSGASADSLQIDSGPTDSAVADTSTTAESDADAANDTATLDEACKDLAEGAPCDDGDLCTENTTCQSGLCTSGKQVKCDATSPCKVPACVSHLGCVEVDAEEGAACSRACFTEGTCVSGVCSGSAPVECPASNAPCMDAFCDPSDGACAERPKPVGVVCDTPADPCTHDACDDSGMCSVLSQVDDGTACGAERECRDGACVARDCAPNCASMLPCPTFSAGANAPDDLRNTPIAIVGGASIHLLGGSPSTQHYVYTPGSGWIAGTTLEDGVGEGAGVLIGTHWYLVDGDDDEAVRIFDLVQGEWSLGATRPAAPPRGPAGGTDGVSFFVAGGADGNLHGTTATHRYDPAGDSWTTVAPMPTARGFVAHAVVGSRLYVFGGRDRAVSGSSVLDAAEAYDMTTNTWHTLADMPTRRNTAFAAAVGDHIVVAGGFSGSAKLDVVEIYDTVNDTWRTCETGMNSAFSGGAAATLNGTLYLFGGGADELGVEIGSF